MPYQFHAICRPPKGCRSDLQGMHSLYSFYATRVSHWKLSVLENMLYNVLPQKSSAKQDDQHLYLTCAESPKSDGNGNNSTSSLCSMLGAIVPTLYTQYLVYAAGIHCHLEESPAMFLGDEMLGFVKEYWKGLFQITLLKDPSWRRRENVLVNDTVELLMRALWSLATDDDGCVNDSCWQFLCIGQ